MNNSREAFMESCAKLNIQPGEQAWQLWQAARAGRPEPGTTEYGSWINSAAKESDMVFGLHSQRFKWLCHFEQTLTALANKLR